MLAYQAEAIDRVRAYAMVRDSAYRADLAARCAAFGVDARALAAHVLRSPVTINFHPDRFSGNGRTVLENLLEQGQYHGQFRTGTTNGGRTAYVGGDRFLWERRMFFDAYPQDALDRPKYGALNLFGYTDGASVRFGSCFLSLKPGVLSRCTFSYGDSSTNPATLCTGDTFAGVLWELLEDVRSKGLLLNQAVSSQQEALAILLYTGQRSGLGRNLDACVEAHIHGDILLERDAACFCVDGSFEGTAVGAQAQALCRKYNLALCWTPQRRMETDAIGPLFRGPMIPVLAKRIDRLWGGGQGVVNAALIGRASRDMAENPGAWADLGSEWELFQYVKQLWHTVGFFG